MNVLNWFRLKPYQHQIQAFKLALQYECFAFLMDMGTGKSACIIAACNYWGEEHNAKNVLIVIPKTAIAAWRNQLDTHSVLDYNVIDMTTGTKQARLKRLKSKKNVMNYCIINYDSLKSFEQPFKDWAQIVVLDESHKIKTYNSQRTRSALRLAKTVTFKLIATGTLMETPVDVWAQYAFIGAINNSFYSFRNEFVEFNEWTRQITGSKNDDKLNKIIYSRGYRVTKEECLDLPDKVDVIQEFELAYEQQMMYDEMKEDAVIQIGKNTASAPIVLTQYLRLQQITSGFVKTNEGNNVTVGTSKLDALIDIVDSASDKKILIFCRFKWEFTAIQEALSFRKCCIISGDTKNRIQLIDDFRRTDTYDTIIVQINVGSTAIELFECHTVIYYSTTFGYIDYHQSRDRVHRIGQTHKVTYYHLHAKDTIDGYIYEAISKKHDVATNMLSIFERMKRE